MKIYYRGYLISKVELPEQGCMVQGRRPQRETLAFEGSTMSAMKWIDRDVMRHRVEAAGWLIPSRLPA